MYCHRFVMNGECEGKGMADANVDYVNFTVFAVKSIYLAWYLHL